MFASETNLYLLALAGYLIGRTHSVPRDATNGRLNTFHYKADPVLGVCNNIARAIGFMHFIYFASVASAVNRV